MPLYSERSLKIYDESGKLINLYIEGGIAEISQNVIGVLTEKAIYKKDINIEAIKSFLNKYLKIIIITSLILCGIIISNLLFSKF